MNLSHRMWRNLSALAAVGLGASAAAQGVPEGPPTPPRNLLPFATEPDRLPGPPRAVGELPAGASQPPSTLPGRVRGEPPRAMGESPALPPANPALGPFLPGLPPGAPRIAPPTESAPFAPPLPPGSFFPPVPFRAPGGTAPAPGRVSELPPALPGAGLATPPGTAPPSGARPPGPPLFLEEVLASAERSYPPLQAVLLEQFAASGELLSARGAFDLNLNADSRNWPLGFFNRSLQDVFLEQPLTTWGAKVFGGYRLAQGNWPIYYNYLNTRGGGAFVGGLELPLLKNRAIDAKRAKLLQAEIERRKVEPTILKQRIELFKNASKAYVHWVAAGRAYAIYRDLVRVAESRNEGLDRQAREGLVRPIDLVDFRRILLSRQQQEVTARRRFEQAAIDLSMYLRGGHGFPVIPEPVRLPLDDPPVPPPDPSRFGEDLEVALRLRPEILSLRLQAQKAQVDCDYARNQLLPSLNLYVYTEQNVGNRAADLGTDFRPFIMESSLLFDVPLQRRYAKGRVQAADAALRQIAAQARFAWDRVRADVLDAQSALRAAQEQLARSRENELVNRRLEEAERTLLREGNSTVLFLNLREQATSDARIARVEAEAKFFSALADYRAALGLDAVPPDRLY